MSVNGLSTSCRNIFSHACVIRPWCDFGNAGAADLPLWGKRIVVTAPRQYAAKLGAALLEAGAVLLSDPSLSYLLAFGANSQPRRAAMAPPGWRAGGNRAPSKRKIVFVHDVSMLLDVFAHFNP